MGWVVVAVAIAKGSRIFEGRAHAALVMYVAPGKLVWKWEGLRREDLLICVPDVRNGGTRRGKIR